MKTLLSVSLTLLAISGQAHAATFTLDQAIAQAAADQQLNCDFGSTEGQDYDAIRKEWSSVTEVKGNGVDYQIFQIYCTAGAYNVNSVFYLGTSIFDKLAPISFADISFDDKGRVNGYTTTDSLTNASVEANGEGSFFAKGRGLGDCFNSGTYKFDRGQFVLKLYEQDAKCDGKINPKKIVNFK